MSIPNSEREPPAGDILMQPPPPSHGYITVTAHSYPSNRDVDTNIWGPSSQVIPRFTTLDLTRPLPQLPKEIILQIMKLLGPLDQFLFSLTASEYRREYNHYKLGGIFHNDIWPIYPRSDSWLIPIPLFKWPSMIDSRITSEDSTSPESRHCSTCDTTLHRKYWKQCHLEKQIAAWDAEEKKKKKKLVSQVHPILSKKIAISKTEDKGTATFSDSRGEKAQLTNIQGRCEPKLKTPVELVWDLLTSVRTSNPLYAGLLREERKYKESRLPVWKRSDFDVEEMHMPAGKNWFCEGKCTRCRVQEIVTVRGRRNHVVEEFGDDCDSLVSIGVPYWNCAADGELDLNDLSAFEGDGGMFWISWEELWKKLEI